MIFNQAPAPCRKAKKINRPPAASSDVEPCRGATLDYIVAKTYKNLYGLIYDFANLHTAYLASSRSKRYRQDVLRFTQNLEFNLICLQNELIWKTYTTGRYRHFFVYEPKKRAVVSLPFRDRVIQHALVSVIEPIWERRFIYDSYACRRGRGTHRAVNRAQAFIRAVKLQHGKVYVLKADISKYFASIDHQILWRLLGKRIACADTMRLLGGIIDSTPGQVGIPIGNLTSQLFANIYLHELDEHVKYALRESCYVRYMDDFIIVHHDKGHLHELRRVLETFLWENLRLQTNAKTQVFPVALRRGRGLDFLGYKIWASHKEVKKKTIKRMVKQLKRLRKQYAADKITWQAARASVMSWLGHIKHADSYKQRTKILAGAMFCKKKIN